MPFAGIEKMISQLQAFDPHAELLNIVSSNTEVLADYIRDQLSQGLDGNDQPNTIFGKEEYANATVFIKLSEGSGLGAVVDYITNYMTGDFYASLKVNVEGDLFDADSDVPYFGDIRLYSSEALLKVNAEHRLQFAKEYVIPGMAVVLLQKTNLKLTGAV